MITKIVVLNWNLFVISYNYMYHKTQNMVSITDFVQFNKIIVMVKFLGD